MPQGSYGTIFGFAASGQCGCEMQQTVLAMGYNRFMSYARTSGLVQGGFWGGVAGTGPLGQIVAGGAGVKEGISGLGYAVGDIAQNGLNPCNAINAILSTAGTIGSAVDIGRNINGLRSTPNGSPTLPNDDPLIDNNVLQWIYDQDPGAIEFANRYSGNLTIDRTIVREFYAGGHTSGDLRPILQQYDISVVPGATTADAEAIVSRLGRPGMVVNNDLRIIATAEMYDIRFATGDFRAAERAISLGVDTRYVFFAPNIVGASRLSVYRSFAAFLRKRGYNPLNHMGNWR